MKRKIAAFTTLFLFSTTSLAATQEKDLAKCAVITADLDRLECFDSLTKAKKLNTKQPLPTTEGNGKWNVSWTKNPVDDSKTVTLVLDADSGRSRWGNNISMVARCKSNKTNLYINWNDYLGRKARVLSRIGSNKAVTRTWSISTDSKATFHPRPISFLKEMMKSDKLVAQITPYNESPVTAIFNTAGLVNAIKLLRETCHW